MQIRRLEISRYRGIESLRFDPGPRTVILGPQNAGKSTVLESLDLLLHHGLGRPRQPPTEIDYFRRDPKEGFEIEAVVGDLSEELLAGAREHLEGWAVKRAEVVPEPDGLHIEPVVRVRVRGTPDLTHRHEFAKPEAGGAHFGPRLRAMVGWVFDGRTRDPQQQLSFYQGGLLDRLFRGSDLGPATDALREALGQGANQVNEDDGVTSVLDQLGEDLKDLGLLTGVEKPLFEAGAVSQRQLLQSLRLALPSGDETIPLARQGRGAQRLVLVSVLLRLAQLSAGGAIVGGFEEPEEALEPLRQALLAGMLVEIAESGGQVFVVTHSPEIARRFQIDDFLLLAEGSAGRGANSLRKVLTPPVRQTYERRLDGAVVRGLFARVPVLVEGPGDRAVLEAFWRSLARQGKIRPAEELGLDIINCEGVDGLPMHAAVLNQAGKAVVAWTERDTARVRATLERLREEGHCSLILLYGSGENQQNLEQALSRSCTLPALAEGMKAIADDRGYGWADQKADLVSRCDSPEQRRLLKDTPSLERALDDLADDAARNLVKSALGAKSASPFDLKGGRQARIFATSVIGCEGVPRPFASAFEAMYSWILEGCEKGTELEMWDSGAAAGS